MNGKAPAIRVSKGRRNPVCTVDDRNIHRKIEIVEPLPRLGIPVARRVRVPLQSSEHTLHALQRHHVVSDATLTPESVLVEPVLEKPHTAAYGLMDQGRVPYDAPDRSIAFVDPRAGVGVKYPVVTVLLDGAPEQVILDPGLHVSPGFLAQALQFAALVNRVIREHQVCRHLITPPPAPLASRVGVRRFQHERLHPVGLVQADQETREVAGERVQDQHGPPGVLAVARHLIQLTEVLCTG